MIGLFNGKYRFLSNFCPSKILPPTLEHHYQAAKTTDSKLNDWIMFSSSAYIANKEVGMLLFVGVGKETI